jgi:hypothetical protein
MTPRFNLKGAFGVTGVDLSPAAGEEEHNVFACVKTS